MRLSEAMRLGAMLRPQAFDALYLDGATCAMGAAVEALGLLDHATGLWRADAVAPNAWLWIRGVETSCPDCGNTFFRPHPIFGRCVQVVIVHLNNDHKWTRERIADWLETIEAQREQPILDPQSVSVEA